MKIDAELAKAAMRRVFKLAFNINQDEDFAWHTSATMQQVHDYGNNIGNGPDPNNLRIDMRGPLTNAWNRRVIEILKEKFHEYRQARAPALRTPERPDEYIERLIVEKILYCQSYWKKARPQTGPDGEQETLEAIQTRLERMHEENAQRQRRLT